MPAEWDTYLERMGVEQANAPCEHKARAYPERGTPIHAIFGVEGLRGNAHRSRAKRHRGRRTLYGSVPRRRSTIEGPSTPPRRRPTKETERNFGLFSFQAKGFYTFSFLASSWLITFRLPLAAHFLHALAHEEADELRVALFVTSNLIGVRGNHGIDNGLDGARVAYLFHATFVNDGRRVLILVNHGSENFLALLRGNCIGRNKLNELNCARGRKRAFRQVERLVGIHARRDVVNREVRERLSQLEAFSPASSIPFSKKFEVARCSTK